MKKNILWACMVSILLLGCTPPANKAVENKAVSSKTEIVSEPETIQVEEIEGDVATEENTEGAEGAEKTESLEKKEALQAEIMEFSTEKVAEIQGKKKFAVFFHASWCPTCVKWEKMVRESIGELPKETIILIADYDNTGLRDSFRVGKQSTAIFYDEGGRRVNEKMDPPLEEMISFFSS